MPKVKDGRVLIGPVHPNFVRSRRGRPDVSLSFEDLGHLGHLGHQSLINSIWFSVDQRC